MFHLKDGLYFERLPNGEGVRIVLKPNNVNDDRVLFETTTDYEGVASVVSTVSQRGEAFATWRAIVDFLREPSA